jgi:hypothetical protein
MNKEIVLGKWKTFGATIIRQWWPEFTAIELDHINGSWNRLVCKVQEKFGYTNYAYAEIACRSRIHCNQSNHHVLFSESN